MILLFKSSLVENARVVSLAWLSLWDYLFRFDLCGINKLFFERFVSISCVQ